MWRKRKNSHWSILDSSLDFMNFLFDKWIAYHVYRRWLSSSFMFTVALCIFKDTFIWLFVLRVVFRLNEVCGRWLDVKCGKASCGVCVVSEISWSYFLLSPETLVGFFWTGAGKDSQETANAVQEIGGTEALQDSITEAWILAGCEGCNWYKISFCWACKVFMALLLMR